ELFAKFGADLFETLEQRFDLAETLGDIAGDILARIELRLLLQVANGGAFRRPGLAAEILFDARHDLEQRRFAGAVRPKHTDLRTGKEGKADVFEDLAAAGIGFPETLHDVDVLVSGHL